MSEDSHTNDLQATRYRATERLRRLALPLGVAAAVVLVLMAFLVVFDLAGSRSLDAGALQVVQIGGVASASGIGQTMTSAGDLTATSTTSLGSTSPASTVPAGSTGSSVVGTASTSSTVLGGGSSSGPGGTMRQSVSGPIRLEKHGTDSGSDSDTGTGGR
ncbi:MAG: hypothetical protein H5T84_00060 [Thermoleophilia bacterium]|nr:hypothetical protein [Thermoleophilia bacterium]